MNTTWKKFVALLLLIWVNAAAGYILYNKTWTKWKEQYTLTTPLPTINQPFGQNSRVTTYSNPDMNISFQHPSGLKVSLSRPHVLSITNPLNTSTDNILYIFETTMTNNTKTVDIPFVIKGKLTKQTPVPIHGFTAKQLIYSDGINFLTLQNDKQFIMVRIPKNSSGVDEAITDFVNTIKSIK